jgi:AcrR family transcriptional regulator
VAPTAPASSGTDRRPRRTQRERREATIARLIDATVATLIELGFARASVREICARAGISDGGLFRHFDSRLDLIVVAAEEIARLEVEELEERAGALPEGREGLAQLVRMIRDAARAPRNRVWHELLASARTDAELRERLEPSTRRFVRNAREAFARVPPTAGIPAESRGLWLSLLLHFFDGEAIFTVVAPNPAAEERLLQLVTGLLAEEAAGAGD